LLESHGAPSNPFVVHGVPPAWGQLTVPQSPVGQFTSQWHELSHETSWQALPPRQVTLHAPVPLQRMFPHAPLAVQAIAQAPSPHVTVSQALLVVHITTHDCASLQSTFPHTLLPVQLIWQLKPVGQLKLPQW
jgi:hypothetical protein